MTRKKLMILGGSRYAIPVAHAAHKLCAHVGIADCLHGNAAYWLSGEYGNGSGNDGIFAGQQQDKENP